MSINLLMATIDVWHFNAKRQELANTPLTAAMETVKSFFNILSDFSKNSVFLSAIDTFVTFPD